MNYLLMLGICFVLNLVLSFIFFAKKSIVSSETRLYKLLIITNLFGIVLEMLSIYYSNYLIDNILTTIFVRLYFIYIISFNTILLFYDYAIYQSKSKISRLYNVFKKISLISYLVVAVLLVILPYDQHPGYATGICVNLIYVYSSVLFTTFVVIYLANRKAGNLVKNIPLFILGGLMLCFAGIQNSNPSITIATAFHFITVFIMYHTIENPDVKMLEAMETAKDQAIKANRAKSDFLSSMSHEIRTPLNAIVGFSEDIQNHKGEVPGEVAEDADYIMEASKTLLEIVGNILDINKIESNKMEIHNIKYNPREEILTIARINSVRIGEKPIDFKVMIAEDMPYELYGDKIHIKEIVNNLVSNAIKYTDKGEITLKAYSINKDNVSNLIISVTDTGKGIKADKINRLFSKFDRLDVEKNTTTEGTGLGLAITKALTELMGGKINVQSQFGKGSIFMVQIPQTISMLSKPAETTINTVTTTDDAVANEFSGKRLLVVDDNQLNIKVARRALKDFDFVIDECSDGLQCLEKVTNGNEYDVILMDIMMPNMNGETTLKHLKENPNFKIPTIALTADAITGAEERYREAGFDDYIAKPFTKAEIKEKLDKIFNKPQA